MLDVAEWNMDDTIKVMSQDMFKIPNLIGNFNFHHWFKGTPNGILSHSNLPGIHYSSKHFNTLNAKLNPICHLLALLGAHHILHVSRIRVNIIFSSPPTLPHLLLITPVATENLCSRYSPTTPSAQHVLHM